MRIDFSQARSNLGLMHTSRCSFVVIAFVISFLAWSGASQSGSLALPRPGDAELRILAPKLLELTLVTSEQPRSGSPARPDIPPPSQFKLTVGGRSLPVSRVGFKRRALYAPLKQYDLRVANSWFLEIKSPIPQGETVKVTPPRVSSFSAGAQFTCRNELHRLSPVIHVNQTGYSLEWPKTAMVGYYLGSLGELDLLKALTNEDPASTDLTPTFQIVESQTGTKVFEGRLKPRPDRGFPFVSYEKVFEADFTTLKKPGVYRVFVPGLGTSFPFRIGDEVAGAFARTYALGIYHQRCGTANALPFTRFTHGPCHTAPAEVPGMSSRYESANYSLERETENFRDDPKHSAPRLKNIASSLYPFVRRGKVDVRGGHHDAGDYSKYTINSAGFIHNLVFAADAFPGVAALDNLGIPESGDNKSDILQEAKWEADFLAKMQDEDGGFYFLVYPREREYENNVLPDKGDPQVVFPKTTSVTAAAVAALAQCASSPEFKRQFPDAAAQYLRQAKQGWEFLEKALLEHGFDGAYQKITHYGNEFRHDDELAWAACELFLATGEERYHSKAREWLRPNDPATRKWGWLRLFDSYGNAVRSYAFGAKSGRLKPDRMNRQLEQECQNELIEAARDQLKWAEESAYGTSFSEPTKKSRSAGWYFSGDAAFDLAVASQLEFPERNDPRPAFFKALISNLNYEQGCNPVNVSYLTGLGWKRQREIVHQFAQNDRRVLPPTGIPLGNIQEGFAWLDLYRELPGKLSFPSDGSEVAPYPFYDRWTDGFNLTQEFVILHQARGLGYLAWLMAQTPVKGQPWRAQPASIALAKSPEGTTTRLVTKDLPLEGAQLVWEAEGIEPQIAEALQLPAQKSLPGWIEAEALLPDGRRVFGVLDSPANVAKTNN